QTNISLTIDTDYQNSLLARAASAAFKAEKWKAFLLGDMSSAIDVLFDIDLQRFLNRVWPKRDGVMIITIFSSTEGAIKFFSQAIDASKTKFGNNLHLAIYPSASNKTQIKADFVSDTVETATQLRQTVCERADT